MSESTQHQTSGDAKPPISGGKAIVLLLVVLVVAVILAVTGIIPRLRARTKLDTETNALAAPNVQVAEPSKGKASEELILPGTAQAYTDAGLYARTDGYLKKWYFDIGSHVKEGQLIAVIDSPEIDQELAQAKAELATAQATAGYAKTQATRYQGLLNDNAVAKQDTDNFVTQAQSTDTQVKSAQANVDRLVQLTGFEKIYAPFTGTLTARNVDIGTLIASGNTKELFHLSAEQTLRIYVSVPQVDSRSCQPGMTAGLTMAEYPGRTFTGKIVRTANAIDPASRTLLVEVDVDNRKGELYPGAYMQVHFNLNNQPPSLVIPVAAMLFRSEGLRVAVVQNGKAKMVPITIGKDDGRTVEIVSGLNADDQVIQTPPDSLIDGEAVNVVKPKAQPAESPASGSNTQGGGQKG
ncbi:efflux RND transporter periplasmic adaptor subunit [Silvibacterium acidisoli]|uniref:efflux RND transporter periplasmic adaptor subunit n=1 Tax=Acidobacteriaceae bacterium ZG23-2 TaxID=2883246 RepID=UPI00406C576B